MTTETPAPPGANRTGRDAPDVGAALRELAAREKAPAELDRLLEPLRLRDPLPPLVRPALRWAALAAAVLAAAFWLPRLAHRAMAPHPTTSTVRTHHEAGHYYQLQPLPTADPGEAPQTAAEALQSLEPPAPLPTPAPLEALGPTEEDPAAAGTPMRPWRLDLAGHSYEIELPEALPDASPALLVTVQDGRIVSATSTAPAPLPRLLLEALSSPRLQNVPDGRWRARLHPLPAGR